ncbi:hypothetical protein EUGRSUZ_F01198 [Eucalyptus grandis]|uniref:Uncharacterized protein n=2 Tax=Eucalyptus grandis TaxID=71139 RepID=A0ACC3KDN0_EUCGR|nr:hypothetical protein EUGRSUZ_F01198 [Eucalyptus grandis]
MAFRPNPLSLTVPGPAFESWLRDSGYLELLDQRSSSSSSASAASAAAASDPHAFGFFASVFSGLGTLVSLVTLNPLSKLTTDDFSGETPSWTTAFIGSCDSYSFPSSPAQARLRVHENVRRFACNYATLFILFFACALKVIVSEKKSGKITDGKSLVHADNYSLSPKFILRTQNNLINIEVEISI